MAFQLWQQSHVDHPRSFLSRASKSEQMPAQCSSASALQIAEYDSIRPPAAAIDTSQIAETSSPSPTTTAIVHSTAAATSLLSTSVASPTASTAISTASSTSLSSSASSLPSTTPASTKGAPQGVLSHPLPVPSPKQGFHERGRFARSVDDALPPEQQRLSYEKEVALPISSSLPLASSFENRRRKSRGKKKSTRRQQEDVPLESRLFDQF